VTGRFVCDVSTHRGAGRFDLEQTLTATLQALTTREVEAILNTASGLAVRTNPPAVPSLCLQTAENHNTSTRSLLSSRVSRTMARAVSVRPQTTETRLDRKGHVGFVVDKVALGRVYHRSHRSTSVSSFHNSSASRPCMTTGEQHQ
jgi:hypothetical protein